MKSMVVSWAKPVTKDFHPKTAQLILLNQTVFQIKLLPFTKTLSQESTSLMARCLPSAGSIVDLELLHMGLDCVFNFERKID